MIAGVLIPFFAAAVERRLAPTLATTPLIIGKPSQDPTHVLAVSKEAAHCGVVPGMRLQQAQTLCPHACLIPANPSRYQSVLAELLSVLSLFTACVELDETSAAVLSYLDVGYVAQAEQVKLAQELGRSIREQTHLAPTIGLTMGKFTTWVATASTAPNKALVVASGREATYLAPRSVTFLPLEKEITRRFQMLGLRTLGQLAALPASAVLIQFGKYGHWLQQLARGRDHRPVMPRQAQAEERLAHQFDDPIDNWLVLESLNQALAKELATRLRQSGRQAREMTLTLDLEDGTPWEKKRYLREPTSQPERIEQHLNALLRQAQLHSGIVAVRVSLTDLVSARGQQLDLFTPPTAQEQRLKDCLPNLLARYGPSSFYQVAVTHQTAYLPERRFQLHPLASL